MDLNSITKILTEAGCHVCPICGTPFKPYHSRQKTCATKECKRIYHKQYVQNRVKQLKEKDPEAWRKYHNKANKKWRDKQRKLKERDDELKEVQERWQKQKEFDKKVTEYGHEYGKRSAQKVLENVSKIDVNMGKEQEHDRVQGADEQRRGE